MINIAVFGATVSYVLMMLSHIVLRSREPNLERPYRTPGGTQDHRRRARAGGRGGGRDVPRGHDRRADHARRLRAGGRCTSASTRATTSSPRPPRRSSRRSRAPRPSSPGPTSAMDLDELRKAVQDGSIDTVLLGFADMQGRFQGKRLAADHFLEEVVSHGAEACNYLLAVDVDMNTVEGYAMSSWETGYGDFEMKPDFDTLRLVPWHEGTAMCMADLHVARRRAGRRVAAADPARASSTGSPSAAGRRFAATELEFIVFRDTYEQAFHKRYEGLEPGNLYNVDYSMLGTVAAGAADRADPARDGAAPGCGWRTPRASATSASTRSTSPTRTRCTPPTRTRSTRTAPRRSPPRRAWRSRSWPSTTSARATRATSTSPCAARTARRCSPSSPSCSTASSPASSPACGS